MANNYYNNDSPLVAGLRARSDQINSERDSVEAAFDNLPTAADSLHTGKPTYVLAGGSDNNYTVSMDNTRTANAAGDEVVFKTAHTHTGAPMLNVDGIGAVEIRGVDLESIPAGGLQSGVIYVVRYNSPYWQLISPPESYSSAAASATAAAASAAAAAASAASIYNRLSSSTAALVVNNSTTLQSFFTLDIDIISGQKYVVELHVTGTQAAAASHANISMGMTLTGAASPVTNEYVDVDVSVYKDYSNNKIKSLWTMQDANRIDDFTDYAVLTTNNADDAGVATFLLSGYGRFEAAATGALNIDVRFAQGTAYESDTSFTEGWIKVNQIA